MPQYDFSRVIESSLSGTAQSSERDDQRRWLGQLAPNAIEWCVGKQYVDSPSLYEFTKSYQTIRDFFELRCPECNPGGIEDGQPGDCWGKSRAYLEDEVLLRWSPDLQDDVCPKCRTTRSEFREDGRFVGYNQLNLLSGMRSGKSITGALITTYIEHVMLAIGAGYPGGLHAYFDITPAEVFEITILASNQVQSTDTIWAKYTGFRSGAPWFADYLRWIKAEEKAQPRTGAKKWRYEESTKKIENMHPNVRVNIHALNSNSSGQAGRTRIAGVIDELARMKVTESAQGAAEIYRTQENGLRTIRTARRRMGLLPWLGTMISVTSTMRRDDVAMRLWKLGTKIPGMYTRKYATWEFNPREKREYLDAEYIKDPIGAERDFGSNPPGAEHPFIYDEARWAAACVRPFKPGATFRHYEIQGPTGHRYYAADVRTAVRAQNRQQKRVIVFDAGLTFDAFAAVCMYPVKMLDQNGLLRTVSRLDWAMRVVPDGTHQVWMDSAIQVVRSLQKNVTIGHVRFDRWNSAQPVQAIRALKIDADWETLPQQAFIDFRQDCLEGRCILGPPVEGEAEAEESEDAVCGFKVPFSWVIPAELLSSQGALLHELTGLQQDPDTQKIYNPNKGEERGKNSDDLARCIVHANWIIQRADYNRKQHDTSVDARRRRAVHAGAEQAQPRMMNTRTGGISEPHTELNASRTPGSGTAPNVRRVGGGMLSRRGGGR